MSEATEHMEHAEHAQHAENKKIALLIAILALFLSFSETLGKSAQTEAIDANVKSSDTWNFFQAKDIRKTTLLTAADQTKLLSAGLTDPAAKAAIDKQIAAWRKTADRYELDPKSGTGRKEVLVSTQSYARTWILLSEKDKPKYAQTRQNGSNGTSQGIERIAFGLLTSSTSSQQYELAVLDLCSTDCRRGAGKIHFAFIQKSRLFVPDRRTFCTAGGKTSSHGT